MIDVLLRYSRYPVPHSLLVDIAETLDRYGRLRLEKHPEHGLVLVTTDRPVLEEVLRCAKVKPMLGARDRRRHGDRAPVGARSPQADAAEARLAG